MKQKRLTTIVIVSLIGIVLVFFGTKKLISWLEENKPVAARKQAKVIVPVVEVTEVRLGDPEILLRSEAPVEARRETIISAQVAGRITHVHPDFEIGGSFRAGDLIAQLDPVNYESAVAQAKSSLADAKLTLVQEEARGVQALRDWKKIGGGKTPSDLVLRKPYLESAKARIVAAQAALDRAVEDLGRTRIMAPFDCRVRETDLDLGAMVGVGTRLGVVYDPEQVIVRLPFSLDDFSLLTEDAEIKLETQIAGKKYTWQGEIRWTQGELNRSTLSAFAVVNIRPNEKNPPRFRLPLPGLFVQAQVRGARLSEVVAIPRAAVRGRNEISVMNADDELEFRTLSIVRSSPDRVYVSDGIKDGERVILTKMETPVAGMKLALPDGKDH